MNEITTKIVAGEERSSRAQQSKIRRQLRNPWIITLLALVVALAALHVFVMYRVHQVVNVSVEFGSALDESGRREAISQNAKAQQTRIDHVAPLPKPSPFREVDVFGDGAKDWANFFDGYAAAGVLVFDANGDGRPDVYICRNGNSWVRPTDENGVIQNEPHPQYNTLYINMGNDKNGNPIFKEAAELAAEKGGKYVKEELLIENYLFPRGKFTDSRKRVGRSSSTAIAVDLNNDGRLDLIVGNILPGMIWSDPQTHSVLGQFVRPVGRQAVTTKLPISAQGLFFLKDYKPSDQTDELRESARGLEAIGANSVFLNMGDKDGNGLPEWKDVSRELGLEGKRNTMALVAADFDLDGDIDIFEANIMDMDLFPDGATKLAGAASQLYINQLAETGELKFVESAGKMGVDQLYNKENPEPDYYRLRRFPLVPKEYSVALGFFEAYKPAFLEVNGKKSEPGQIAWAAVAQDVNGDGYPDLWVANDLGFLRLYLNEGGKRFKLATDYPRAKQTGYWMSLSPADFNGDGREDLFAGNIGGGTMNLEMPIPDMYSLFDPVIRSATMSQQFLGDHHNSMHAVMDGASGFKTEMKSKVIHSKVLPPDASLENNIRHTVATATDMAGIMRKTAFDLDSLDPYEFTWGSTPLDVHNDGKQDLYWVGGLYGRGGGIFSIIGTGPGRLLVNATEDPSKLRFVDQTAEHHLFNILELNYDRLESEGYVYRKAPLQNWGKRSVVNSYDVSVWGFHGPGIVERITNHDLIQTAENGRAAIAADLNGDGYADIIVRNVGGYDSRSSRAVNLKARINGNVEVIPAHDPNFPTPTNYEPGSTRVFLNTYHDNNWIKVQLIDDAPGSYNRDAIGAQVIVNNRSVQVKRAGGGGFISNYCGPLLFGLNKDTATTIQIHWPDRVRTVTNLPLSGLKNGLLTVSKTKGLVDFRHQGS